MDLWRCPLRSFRSSDDELHAVRRWLDGRCLRPLEQYHGSDRFLTPAGVLSATGVAVQWQASLLCSPRAAHPSCYFALSARLRAAAPRAAPFDQLPRRPRGLRRTSEDILLSLQHALQPNCGGQVVLNTSKTCFMMKTPSAPLNLLRRHCFSSKTSSRTDSPSFYQSPSVTNRKDSLNQPTRLEEIVHVVFQTARRY